MREGEKNEKEKENSKKRSCRFTFTVSKKKKTEFVKTNTHYTFLCEASERFACLKFENRLRLFQP